MNWKEEINLQLKRWVRVTVATNEFLTTYLDAMSSTYWKAVKQQVKMFQQSLNEVVHVNKTNLLIEPKIYVTPTGNLEYTDNQWHTQPIDGVIPQQHHYYDSTQPIEFLYFYGYEIDEEEH